MSQRDGHEWRIVPLCSDCMCEESCCQEKARWEKVLISCDKSSYSGGMYCEEHSEIEGNLMSNHPAKLRESNSNSHKVDFNSEEMSISREQWMIAKAISGIVMAYNAPHCSKNGEKEAVNVNPDYVRSVAAYIADFCDKDHMAIEDMIDVLKLALEVCETHRSYLEDIIMGDKVCKLQNSPTDNEGDIIIHEGDDE